ncbi:MAG: LLM class flavin-dependent oxidoreductase [Azospirillaceae bacterium]|nr:LLM class flavin-dependent oxidoreductase [Azospirillaceae bacterium]
MYLSIHIDVSPQDADRAPIDHRADRIEAAKADFVLLARETDGGGLQPSRVEAVVTLPWITGRLSTPVVVAALPALHAVPFHIARALSAADFLSAGRCGWMPMTAGGARYDAAYGDGYRLADDQTRAKYEDFIRATQALWDSWDDDALIIDKAAGVYLDSAKVRRVDYRGPFFSSMGPLNAARPPQGYPVLVRDLDDVAESAVPADVVLGSLSQLAAAGAGAVRLVKATAATVDQAVGAVREGAADGLHLVGESALELLEALRAKHPVAEKAGATARARLGLTKPANPYSERAQA